jgi:hypothetical protein
MRIDINLNTGISTMNDDTIFGPESSTSWSGDISKDLKRTALSEDQKELVVFHTLKEAAHLLNLHYWQLLNLANRHFFPVYQIGNQRKRVIIAEVVAAIKGQTSGRS